MSLSPVQFRCSQCGASGIVHAADDTRFSRVMQDIENDHARQHAECPFDTHRLTVELL